MPAVTAIEVRYADMPCHYRVAPNGGKKANQGNALASPLARSSVWIAGGHLWNDYG
jgi:hypothetical protein